MEEPSALEICGRRLNALARWKGSKLLLIFVMIRLFVTFGVGDWKFVLQTLYHTVRFVLKGR